MSRTQKKILIVDDELHQIETVCRGLFLYGYACRGVTSVDEALSFLKAEPPVDLLITDLTMPEQSGMTLINKAREQYPELPVLVITGLVATEETEKVLALDIPMLQKPFDPQTLVDAIEAQFDNNPHDNEPI